MLEMDQILKANELSISLIAAVPAFLVAGGSLYYLGRWVGGWMARWAAGWLAGWVGWWVGGCHWLASWLV
jgi:hypothetical protein